MFKDYYAILEICYPSSAEEIKKAYKSLSLKWHPDRNPGENTEAQMKDINEAYGILNNQDTKSKHDSEYIIFQNRHHKQSSHSSFYDENSQRGYSSTTANYNPGREHYYEYNIHDDDLKQDIYTARKAADTFVEELIISLKHDSKIVVSGAFEEAKYYIISAIIISVLFGIIQLFT